MKGAKPSLVVLLVFGGICTAFALFSKDQIQGHHVVVGIQGVLLLFFGALLGRDIYDYSVFLSICAKTPPMEADAARCHHHRGK